MSALAEEPNPGPGAHTTSPWATVLRLYVIASAPVDPPAGV